MPYPMIFGSTNGCRICRENRINWVRYVNAPSTTKIQANELHSLGIGWCWMSGMADTIENYPISRSVTSTSIPSKPIFHFYTSYKMRLSCLKIDRARSIYVRIDSVRYVRVLSTYVDGNMRWLYSISYTELEALLLKRKSGSFFFVCVPTSVGLEALWQNLHTYFISNTNNNNQQQPP